jgi:hypothetical protein
VRVGSRGVSGKAGNPENWQKPSPAAGSVAADEVQSFRFELLLLPRRSVGDR